MELTDLIWRKASKSHEDGDQCVEIASASAVVAVRDSKNPDGPVLIFGRNEFRRFASALKNLSVGSRGHG